MNARQIFIIFVIAFFLLSISSLLWYSYLPKTPERCTLNNIFEPWSFASISDKHISIAISSTFPQFLLTLPSYTQNCRNVVNEQFLSNGFFAPVETRLFRQILKEGCLKLNSKGQPPLVVDVGANVGYFTNYAASFGCRVIAFEIQPRLAKANNISITINQFTHLAQIHNLGLSDVQDMAKASIDCNDGGKTQIGFSPGYPYVNVSVIRLDDIVDEDILLLKIDTEGYEDHVLKGTSKIFDKYQIQNIICEFKVSGDVVWKREFLKKNSNDRRVFRYKENYDVPPHLILPVIKDGPPRKFFFEGTEYLDYEDAWITTEKDPQKLLSDSDI